MLKLNERANAHPLRIASDWPTICSCLCSNFGNSVLLVRVCLFICCSFCLFVSVSVVVLGGEERRHEKGDSAKTPRQQSHLEANNC